MPRRCRSPGRTSRWWSPCCKTRWPAFIGARASCGGSCRCRTATTNMPPRRSIASRSCSSPGRSTAGRRRFGLELDGSERDEPLPAVPVWLSEKLSNDVASSVLVGDTIFGFDLKDMQSRLHRPSRGEFRAVDFLTGKVRWSSPEPGHAQIIAADGKLVLLNDRGEVILARPRQRPTKSWVASPSFPTKSAGPRRPWPTAGCSCGRKREPPVCTSAAALASAAPAMTAGDLPARTRFDPGTLLGRRARVSRHPAAVERVRSLVRLVPGTAGRSRRAQPLFAACKPRHGTPSREQLQPAWLPICCSGRQCCWPVRRAAPRPSRAGRLRLHLAARSVGRVPMAVSFSWCARGRPFLELAPRRLVRRRPGVRRCSAVSTSISAAGSAWRSSGASSRVRRRIARRIPGRLARPRRSASSSLGHAAALAASFSLYYWSCVGFAFWPWAADLDRPAARIRATQPHVWQAACESRRFRLSPRR